MKNALRTIVENKQLLCNQIKQPEGSLLIHGVKPCENRNVSIAAIKQKNSLNDYAFVAHVTNALPVTIGKDHVERIHHKIDSGKPRKIRKLLSEVENFRTVLERYGVSQSSRPATGFPARCIEGIVVYDRDLSEEEKKQDRFKKWVAETGFAWHVLDVIIFGQPIKVRQKGTKTGFQGPYTNLFDYFEASDENALELYVEVKRRIAFAYQNLIS